MKNIISILLAVVLSFSFVGCSSSKTKATTSNNKTTQTTKTNTVKSGNTSKNSGEDLYERLFVDDTQDYNYDTDKDEKSYIGNKNTKKFHRSDCSYLPKEKNRVYFSEREDATDKYYKPCKNCNP